MKVLVFSHTVMGRDGFCTNVGGVNDQGQVWQWRLRMPPNRSMWYSDLGANANLIRRQLLPGAEAEIDHPQMVEMGHRRITHPEDVIMVNPTKFTIVDPVSGREKLRRLAEQSAFNSVYDLFPGMAHDNGKWYRPAGQANARAVGYVRVQAVRFHRDGENLRAFIRDFQDDLFDVKVVGIDLVGQRLFPTNILLARLSLASPFGIERWAHTIHPRRCYLMLSHVICRE